MSRWLWPWSNCVKERVCRYLLHHYLGHFFQEHLSLDQLSLDLYKGSVALRDIHLEIWVRNQAWDRGGGGRVARRGLRTPAKGSGWGDQAEGVERPWESGPSQATDWLQSQSWVGRGSLPPLHGRRN